MLHSFTIKDLPHLEAALDEAALDSCIGGSADASTATYAGSGVAVAAASASADGPVALTRARTDALVRQGPFFSMSRATAFAAAVSHDGNNLQKDISFSISFYFGPA